MYAMLGDVRFETLQSFSSLEAQHSAKFAKHEVLKGRPRLQAMENELTTLKFGLKLHWMLGKADFERLPSSCATSKGASCCRLTTCRPLGRSSPAFSLKRSACATASTKRPPPKLTSC